MGSCSSPPFSHRDLQPPVELVTHRETGEFELIVRVRGGLQHYTLDYHPLDIVGWDGYVYPYTFNIHDFEPRTGRIHLPPPPIRPSRGRTSSSARSARGSSTTTPTRSRSTTTRTCSPRR